MRPLWLCRTCGHPWPCAVARLGLRKEHAENPTATIIYLHLCLYEAAMDLRRLHPDARPDADALHERFVAWARRRPGS